MYIHILRMVAFWTAVWTSGQLLAAPTVTTAAATSVSNTTANLNGAANPTGAATVGWFRYASSNPGTCNDTFGTRAPASSFNDTVLGSGNTSVAYSQVISGLAAGTTYFFCAIASSADGTAFGAVISLTTADAPTATTSTATLVTSISATFNGSANPNRAATTGWFRYSATNPGACNDAFGTRAPTSSSGTVLGAGTTGRLLARDLGLLPGTTYYFCAIE